MSDAGLLQPILVIREDCGTYEVIDGARRLAALRELGVQELIVGRDVVIDAEETEADARFKQIIVNVQRENLNAVELGHAFVTLKEVYGYQYNEISEIIGKTPHYVTGKVGLVKRLDPQVQRNYLDEVEDAKADKCIQSKFSDDRAVYPMNVNVLEDIARLPQERQLAAYEEIKAREMDKDTAIGYLRELKEAPVAAGPPGNAGATPPAMADGKVREQIQAIRRDIGRLADSMKGAPVEPTLVAEIESLIKQLCLLCVSTRIRDGPGMTGQGAAEKAGLPAMKMM